MYLVIQTTHGLNLIKMLNKSHVIILCVYIYFTDNTETNVDYFKEYIPSNVLEVFLKLIKFLFSKYSKFAINVLSNYKFITC